MKPKEIKTPGKEINLDCPVSIVNLTLKPFNLKCEKCKLIPNFSLYNYKDIKLNLFCNEGHSNNLNLDNYIKEIKNVNTKEFFCPNCNKNDEVNYCQFCNKYLCQKCNLNHFTIEHIFKNDILKDFAIEEEIKEKYN